MSWLAGRLEDVVRRLEKQNQFSWLIPNGCCGHEIKNARLATYDWERLGVFKASHPEQANLLIVSGWVNSAVAEEIKVTYDRMIKPVCVIAIGSCAITGSPFDTFDPKRPPVTVSSLIPVDVYVPGCPPRPEAILRAILELQSKLNPGPSHREVLHEALRD
ncbi:MAG: NADH-quinone oxidoreductase subunit NuoB [Oligoflexia bacterium]|nr:NADH-quinone oxidoreductase subunit NuoB [Oligoflexia bacterium]